MYCLVASAAKDPIELMEVEVVALFGTGLDLRERQGIIIEHHF